MVMIFSHPKVREYLLKHKLVYTFRTYHPKTADGVRKQIGKDWANAKRLGKKIADIHITALEPINALNMGEVLTKYARESGFYRGHGSIDDAVSDWARAINELNPDEPTAGWIYQIDTLGNQVSLQNEKGMGWRIFMRGKLDSDEWGGTRTIYDWEAALDGFLRLDEHCDDIDIMLVRVERVSSVVDYGDFKKPDIPSSEQTTEETPP